MSRSLTIVFVVLNVLNVAVLHANNVEVVIEGNELYVFGDNDSNSIVIAENSGGKVVVRGNGGTTVNDSRRVVLSDTFQDIDIQMNGGNDRVVLSNLSLRHVEADLGAGNDRFLSNKQPCSFSGGLEVAGRDGDEIVRVVGWDIGGECEIIGNSGKLNARLQSLQIGQSLEVFGNSAPDVIRLSGMIVTSETSISTFGAGDRVQISDSITGELEVLTGAANDALDITDVVALREISVVMGAGADIVDVETVESGIELEVLLGAGADELIVMDVSAGQEISLAGNSGADVLDNLSLDAPEIETIGFEDVSGDPDSPDVEDITRTEAGEIAAAHVGGRSVATTREDDYGAAWEVEVVTNNSEFEVFVSAGGEVVRVLGPFPL